VKQKSLKTLLLFLNLRDESAWNRTIAVCAETGNQNAGSRTLHKPLAVVKVLTGSRSAFENGTSSKTHKIKPNHTKKIRVFLPEGFEFA
jgi:hypothetical protein